MARLSRGQRAYASPRADTHLSRRQSCHQQPRPPAPSSRKERQRQAAPKLGVVRCSASSNSPQSDRFPRTPPHGSRLLSCAEKRQSTRPAHPCGGDLHGIWFLPRSSLVAAVDAAFALHWHMTTPVVDRWPRKTKTPSVVSRSGILEVLDLIDAGDRVIAGSAPESRPEHASQREPGECCLSREAIVPARLAGVRTICAPWMSGDHSPAESAAPDTALWKYRNGWERKC